MQAMRGFVVLILLLTLPWVVLAMFGPRTLTAEPAADEVFGGLGRSGPLVVELFTSQGCSSCPPADRLLGELGTAENGVEVVPLAFHVDYWNYLGWRDPFSSKRWSQRQRDYARVLPGGRVYTPQLVVAGREHLVGSNARSVERALAKAARRAPSGTVALEAQALGEQRAVEVRVAAEMTRAGGGTWDLWVALRQSGLVTPVDRGENARRQLENDFVVRHLERAFTLEGEAGARRERRLRLELEPGWDLEQVQIVAFLQSVDSLEIDGAAVARLDL